MTSVTRLRQSLALTLLATFPRKLQSALVDDTRFRRHFGVEMEAVVTVGQNVASLQRSAFYRAIREAYAQRGQAIDLRDEEGRTWQLSIEERGGVTHVAFRRGQQTALLPAFYALDGKAKRRLAAFLAAAREVNLPAERVKHWQRLLRRRVLNDEEVGELDADIAQTPARLERSIGDDIETGFSKLGSLVPSMPAYIDRLIGADVPAETIEDYAREAIGHQVAQAIAWDATRGARLALLLAGHGSVMPAIPEEAIAKIDIPALATWALEHGDPISQLGMVEIGVGALALHPEIEDTLVAIVKQLLSEDPVNENGRLALLSASFILADGELGRAQVLQGGRPFRRRLAALAQASLIHREIWGKVDAARFSTWALEQRAYDFFCRTLVDLRAEPRWMPNLASAQQFGHEIVGRLASLRGRQEGTLPAGPLRDLLTSDSEDALAGRLSLMAFWPGPLEGHQSEQANALPSEISDLIVDSLSAPELEPKAFFALINARGFAIDAKVIDLAIRSLQDAKYRLKEKADTLSSIYFGLAGVAAAQRRPDLAQELRILVRRGREHGRSISATDELRIAMTAAAAHVNTDDWSAFVGNWALELAMGELSREAAASLLLELEHLIRLGPDLARETARAQAALAAVIDM